MAPRWTTKLFAIQCVKQLMIACKDVPHHVDLQKARQKLKVTFWWWTVHISWCLTIDFDTTCSHQPVQPFLARLIRLVRVWCSCCPTWSGQPLSPAPATATSCDARASARSRWLYTCSAVPWILTMTTTLSSSSTRPRWALLWDLPSRMIPLLMLPAWLVRSAISVFLS